MDSIRVPEEFFCPITREIMKDPVQAADGHTYERNAITNWFGHNHRSPLTGNNLENKKLTTNFTLKKMIDDFQERQSQKHIKKQPKFNLLKFVVCDHKQKENQKHIKIKKQLERQQQRSLELELEIELQNQRTIALTLEQKLTSEVKKNMKLNPHIWEEKPIHHIKKVNKSGYGTKYNCRNFFCDYFEKSASHRDIIRDGCTRKCITCEQYEYSCKYKPCEKK